MSPKAAMKSAPPSGSLYERDPYTWALEQARALRERRPAGVDWDNLAEEVEDLAGRQADSLNSFGRVLIEHLLKLAYASGQLRADNLGLWTNSARNSRIQIEELLQANPGLKSRAAELFAKAWPLARNDALGKLDLDDSVIGKTCPWTFDRAADENFWPPAVSATRKPQA
jgi:hypothetical protein